MEEITGANKHIKDKRKVDGCWYDDKGRIVYTLDFSSGALNITLKDTECKAL